MKRLASASGRVRRGGYTIVELLMATTLTLILMGVVATIFGSVSRSVHQSRATLEMSDRLRSAKQRLELDLKGVTATMVPTLRPDEGQGYFEIREGPMGAAVLPWWFARDSDRARTPDATDPIPYAYDTTVTDLDDVLAFTSRSREGLFVGRFRNGLTGKDVTVEAEEAEIIWFVRGRTLYRRVLLIAPQRMSPTTLADWGRLPFMDNNYDSDMDPTSGSFNPVDDPTDANGVVDLVDLTDGDGNVHGFHEWYDVSARPEIDRTGTAPARPNQSQGWGWVPNSLGDLTKRENRYAHRVHPVDDFPYDLSRWGALGVPTLRETARPDWMGWADAASMPGLTNPYDPNPFWIDFWVNPHPWPEVDPATGTLLAYQRAGTNERVAEDVILTNVIGFDVKVWDPEAPLFRAVNDWGTPYDLTDDRSVTGVMVKPGDPGYPLALAHWAIYRRTGSAASGDMPANGPVPLATGAYVDLNYSAYAISAYLSSAPATPQDQLLAKLTSTFSGSGHLRSKLHADHTQPDHTWDGSAFYDTWSLHYENDSTWIDSNGNGLVDPGERTGDQDGDGLFDEGTDGFDNDGNGVVDDLAERETMPPYPVPLEGIQVEIRTFEPDSRQVRTVTLVADLPTK